MGDSRADKRVLQEVRSGPNHKDRQRAIKTVQRDQRSFKILSKALDFHEGNKIVLLPIVAVHRAAVPSGEEWSHFEAGDPDE